jgi:hypothetical protein
MAADEPVDLRKDSIQLTPELRVSRTSTPYGMDIAFETSTAAWAGQILEVTDESCRPWMFVALAQDDRGASGAVEVATDAERVRVWVSESAFPVDELSASDADVVVRSAKASRRTTRNAWRAIARSHPETHFINEAVRKAFAD